MDRNDLDQLFRNILGFEVLTFKDLNKENFKEKLSHMANYIAMSPFQYDRLFVAILSHGDKVSTTGFSLQSSATGTRSVQLAVQGHYNQLFIAIFSHGNKVRTTGCSLRSSATETRSVQPAVHCDPQPWGQGQYNWLFKVITTGCSL